MEDRKLLKHFNTIKTAHATELRHEVLMIGHDIVQSERFQRARHVPHHIRFNVATHSIETAMYSLLIVRWLNRCGIQVSREDAVRTCLLHDIGMTESWVHDSPSYRKAFSHPKRGYQIARDEYNANKVQLDAIRWHMWPICLMPPKHVIGWILFMSDKLSTFNEGLIIAKMRKKLKSARKAAKAEQARKARKAEETQNAE